MSFSSPTISHTFINADGTPASGTVQFTLSKRMTNGSSSYVPASISANLNSSGVLSQAVPSNLDPGTYPTDSEWRVDIRIMGCPEEQVVGQVPPLLTETNGSTTAGSPIVQLSSLTAVYYMRGQSITGSNVPASTTILSVNVTTNQITMSANATGNGSALTLTLGATLDLGAFLPQGS